VKIDFFVKLKKWSSTVILSVGVKYSLHDLLFDVNICLTYKVAICVTYGKWCQRSLWHQLWIPFLNHLLDEAICKKFFHFHIFFFFWFSIMILSYTLILPMSQLRTQQLMTSQIRSHIEYYLLTYSILVLSLYSKLARNVATLAVLIRFNNDSW